MTVGSKVQDLQAVVSFGTLTIRAPVDEEWTIHNIYHERDCRLKVATVAQSVVIESVVGNGAWTNYWFNVTNSQWLEVENLTSMSNVIGYDGVRTK